MFSSPEFPDHIIVKKSTRARRLALRLDPKDRAFHLIVPRGVSMRRAQAFAEDHERWMQEKLSDMPSPVYFEHGVILPILGQDVEIRYVDEPMRPSIRMESGILYVRENAANTSGRIERFLKKLARDELEILSKEKAKKIDKKVSKVSVRDTKSRWGSCTSDGNLSYSWRLIFAPPDAFDYVVAHEVAHLKHLNHSQAFWDVCESLSADYESGHGWMRENGDELRRYG